MNTLCDQFPSDRLPGWVPRAILNLLEVIAWVICCSRDRSSEPGQEGLGVAWSCMAERWDKLLASAD